MAAFRRDRNNDSKAVWCWAHLLVSVVVVVGCAASVARMWPTCLSSSSTGLMSNRQMCLVAATSYAMKFVI
ncbi:hypothetical protein OUZ56_028604 [Daphnia magna]|uniref:Uncharacterized protein n=1 Tax=Daphnia magna TaxID=35525 RepID=A0ABR0B4I5_9CRUS|nr:hypothetical protein OUZ56_028604 [Daphnia magna]